MSPREPAEFPPRWATAWGDDRFGLWAEFAVNGIVQRLRWIEPGVFWMGSPSEEPERWQNEGPRHLVRLSQGFWLADTACTQALWLAVMGGENPSHFSDDERKPVERVSFDDVERFLDRLRGLLPAGSEPALPTEAQWEYACRAASETPFSFGATITPEQVNYDGNHPYAGAAKGRYRETTVPVKSLPPNPWGLYEMHGNVWEWCADGRREYRELPAAEAETDPVGPREQAPEAHRAVRGGSWIRFARHARSAFRYALRRDVRDHYLGFRLALRSTSPVAP
jgi:formylglycine-generating enzyme required for sulfatase activity